MTTTVTYMFNGRSIESKSTTITNNSIVKLIDIAVEYSDDCVFKPGYTSVYERIVFMHSSKMLCYHRKAITSSGIPVDIRFTITASLPSLYKAVKHFKSLGIMQAL